MFRILFSCIVQSNLLIELYEFASQRGVPDIVVNFSALSTPTETQNIFDMGLSCMDIFPKKLCLI